MKRFITKYYFLPAIALLTLVSVVAVRCKKPTDGININVNTSNLFHYTALVQIVDPSGNVPNGLSVALTGANAAAIYGIDGRKALSAPAGIISIAVHPKMEPTATSPLKFNLVVTGAGYLPLTIPVTISTSQPNQVIKANILNLVVPTAGVATTTTTSNTVAAGTVTAPITIATTPSGGPEATSVTIPAGTKLQDAAGNTVAGNSVALNVNNFNTSQQTAVNLFPGGSLAAANISGGTSSSGVFMPAGFANVTMTVNGTEIKKFSSPINITMTLDPAYKNPSTGTLIAPGQTMGLYSYDTGTGQWQFETNVTVGGTAAAPTVTFTTSHLTVFSIGALQVALNRLTLSFIASWLTTDVVANIRVIAAVTNGPAYNIYDQTASIDLTNLTVNIDGQIPTPTATNSISLTFLSSTGTILATATVAPGTTSLTVTLASPPLGPITDLFLQLDCAGAGSSKVGIFTPPDFYLLYKPTGAPVTSYQILGQVQGGHLITQQLLATQNYDFKASLNQSVKEVINHNISENTSANQTVGGSFNGTKVPTQNKLDIQSLCNTLP
ncbi:hypothetical protein HQ865_00285 [Mucilaginibacter mali]|uniref:Uncharacterized protein n=1 Tax=Mucilaginibacter mali TaxID=2740462 RepID=A0A7D4UMI4_9SPHI|nr:hypothetical protein [Mucilaginibacter mali]QKJ28260.1 hypothetical protein HQ865_00285 [Mucilaginibacter mali]